MFIWSLLKLKLALRFHRYTKILKELSNIAETGDHRAIEVLSLGLNYSDPANPRFDYEVRKAAAKVLGRIGHIDAVPALLARLRQEGPVRSGRDGLIAWTLDGHALVVRTAIINALADIGDSAAILPIVEELENQAKFDTQDAAVRALQKLTGQNFGNNVARWKTWAATGAGQATASVSQQELELGTASKPEGQVQKPEISVNQEIRQKIWNAVGPTTIILFSKKKKDEIMRLGDEAVPALIDIFSNPRDQHGTANQAALAWALTDFARGGNHMAADFLRRVAKGDVPTAGFYGKQAFDMAKEFTDRNLG